MPLPGSPRYERHNRIIFVIVIISYLLYTIYEVDWNVQREGDFYRNLGVPTGVNERQLQSHFRKLYAPTFQTVLQKAAVGVGVTLADSRAL
jgi:preprotein translocase subunit Sec63